MNILFKFATRFRPEKFVKYIENIRQMISDRDKYYILVSADEDDETMRMFKTGYDNDMQIKYGKGLCKVSAINRDINDFKQEWDILINTSDDMWFIQQGFDNIIRDDMRKYFPDTDGVLHYNDGNQKENVMTLSIMGRKYYDRFGYIYHHDYKSVWSDCEATEVAYMLGKYKYMGDDKIIFKHLHPAWGLAPYDAQYRKTESKEVWDADKKVIDSHRLNNYNLNPSEIKNGFKYLNL